HQLRQDFQPTRDAAVAADSRFEPGPQFEQRLFVAGDDWTRLDRFLILGAEGGTYYITERELVKQNHDAIIRCIQQDGIRAVNRIVEISDAGRAPKSDPAIFALALVVTHGDAQAKAHASRTL